MRGRKLNRDRDRHSICINILSPVGGWRWLARFYASPGAWKWSLLEPEAMSVQHGPAKSTHYPTRIANGEYWQLVYLPLVISKSLRIVILAVVMMPFFQIVSEPVARVIQRMGQYEMARAHISFSKGQENSKNTFENWIAAGSASRPMHARQTVFARLKS